MGDTMQVEGGELRRSNDVAHGDLFGRLRECVSPASATRALHEAGPAQPQQNLLDVVDRQALARRDITARDRALRSAARQVERADDAVLGESRYPHECTIGWATAGYKRDAVSAAGTDRTVRAAGNAN